MLGVTWVNCEFVGLDARLHVQNDGRWVWFRGPQIMMEILFPVKLPNAKILKRGAFKADTSIFMPKMRILNRSWHSMNMPQEWSTRNDLCQRELAFPSNVPINLSPYPQILPAALLSCRGGRNPLWLRMLEDTSTNTKERKQRQRTTGSQPATSLVRFSGAMCPEFLDPISEAYRTIEPKEVYANPMGFS